MGKKRQNYFDKQRNLSSEKMANVDELTAQIQQLHIIVEKQEEQVRQYQHQMQQQQQLQQNNHCMLQLTTSQVLKRFGDIKTFYGRGEYQLQEFINTVENVIKLANNNAELIEYGFQVITTEKIQGDAKRVIQRLGNNYDWAQVKKELQAHFRPRRSYKKLLDDCRDFKVSNLRELFSNIKRINYDLNELYELDENKPDNYSPTNNDKNLVDVIKYALNGSYRINISHNMTLVDVFNKFSDFGLLDETDVIHYNFRKNNNSRYNENFKKQHYSNFSERFNKTYNNTEKNEQQRPSYNNKFNYNNNRQNNYNNSYNASHSGQFRQSTYNDSRQNQNNSTNNGQFRQNTYSNSRQNQYSTNNSGQNRQQNYNNSEQSRRSQNSESKPMEVDNITQDKINEEVNFTD